MKNISQYAFSGCFRLQQVICSSNLTSIGQYAFYNTFLLKKFSAEGAEHEFEIPLGCETIGDRAFFADWNTEYPKGWEVDHTAVDAVYVNGAYKNGEAVGEIGAYAFTGYNNKGKYMSKTLNVQIGDGVKTIGAYAFAGDINRRLWDNYSNYMAKFSLVPNTIGKNVETIGYGAFYECLFAGDGTYHPDPYSSEWQKGTCLFPIVIPRSVKKIGDYAFYNCAAAGVEFDMNSDGSGASLEEIGMYAFSVKQHFKYDSTYYQFANDCNLTKYTTLDNWAESRQQEADYCKDEDGKEWGWFGPDSTKKLLKKEDRVLLFPKSLKKIKGYAFYENHALAGISFMGYDAALEEIGAYAFTGCDLSDRVDYLPGNLKEIGDYAFYNTAISGTLHLENTQLVTIRNGTFKCDDDRNKQVYESVGRSHRVSTFTTVNFPATLEEIQYEAFMGSQKLENLNFKGKKLSYIQYRAFKSHETYGSLRSIKGLEGSPIRIIQGGAFCNHPYLEYFPLGDKLRELGYDAFKGTGLKSVAIPGSLREVPDAFPDTLESVTIGRGVEEIKSLTYKHVSKTTVSYNLFVPVGVKKIGELCIDSQPGMVPAIVLSVPGTIESLDFLDVYYAEDETPKSKQQPSFKKIIFRGTEDQWKALMKNHTVDQYRTDYQTVWDTEAPEIVCTEGASGASMEGKCGENLTYTLNNGNLKIEGYDPMYDYDAGHYPWSGQNIKSIEFETHGKGWYTIGDYAFCGTLSSNNANIDLSKCIGIGKGAFKDCTKLTGVTFPKQVNIHMGDSAFEGCIGLTSVSIPLMGRAGEGIFKDCTGLTGVTLSDTTSIPRNAFAGCIKLATLDMPNVTSIPEEAFRGCTSLTTISFPQATSIGDQAFYLCSGLTTADISGVTEIPYGLFGDCTALSNLTVSPNALTSIGDYAFLNCSSLPMSSEKTLYQQNRLRTIGEGAFKGCTSTNFKNVSFTALTSMGREAFASCSNLQTAVIGGVESIPRSAFSACRNLKTVNLTGVKKLDENSFSGCDSLTTFTSTDGALKTIGNLAFSGAGFTGFTIPTSVTRIGREAFKGCTNLTTVDFRSTTNCSLDYESFAGCTVLSTVNGSDRLTSFGMRAFKDCIALTTFDLNPSLNRVPSYAFDGTGLKNIVIPETVRSIDRYAYNKVNPTTIEFKGNIDQWRKVSISYNIIGNDTGDYAGNNCFKKKTVTCKDGIYGLLNTDYSDYTMNWALDHAGNLTIGGHGIGGTNNNIPWESSKAAVKTLTIGGSEGDSIGHIDDSLFAGLSNLERIEVNFDESARWYEESFGGFSGCSKLTSVSISGVDHIRNDAFEGCTALTDVFLGMGLSGDYHYSQSVGQDAFKSCTALENVTIAEGLDKIEKDAFNGCTGLTKVEIPHSVQTIEEGAFTGCGGEGGLTITDHDSKGVTDYYASLTSEEKAKIHRKNEEGEARVRLDKGEILLDLTSGSQALDAGKTAVLVNSIYDLAEEVRATDQGLIVDFDSEQPWAEYSWWKADDICISVAEDGSSVILPLERDDYFVETKHGSAALTADQAYRLALQNKEFYSKITVTFPGETQVTTCTVSFNANGGSGEMASRQIRANSWFTLPYSGFTAPKNKVFNGWDKGVPTQQLYITENIVITALWRDHDHDLLHYEAVAPTCLMGGNHEYYYCAVCEKYFSDSAGRNEVAQKEVFLPKDENAHAFDDWIVEKDPTVSVSGNKYRTCSVCGKRQDKAIPPTAHKHQLISRAGKPATCTASGNIAYYECVSVNVCGYKFYDEEGTQEVNDDANLILPPDLNAHDFDAGITTKAPTCTAEGEKTLTCKLNPNHVRIDPIPALGHDWGEWEIIKEPTATIPGIKRHICKRDKTHVEETVIPTTGGEAPPASLEGWQVSFDERDIKKGADGKYELSYTGAALKPGVNVWHNGELLIEGTDYVLKYAGNTNVTEKGATVTVTGRGVWSEKAVLNFMIKAKNLEDADISTGNTLVEKGKAASPVLAYKGTALRKNKDYKLSGTGAELTAEGIGNFTGKKTIQITELEKSEFKKRAIKVTLKKVSRIYDGTAKTLSSNELVVTDTDKNILVEGRDYIVSYSDNVNVGTVKATVMGINTYCGTVKKSFKIAPAKNASIEVKKDGESFRYVKSGAKPVLSVNAVPLSTGQPMLLKEGRDYKVSYSRNKRIGTAKYTLTFLGNYKGAKFTGDNSFTVDPAVFAKDAQVICGSLLYTKPGKYTPKAWVIVSGNLLTKSEYLTDWPLTEKLTLDKEKKESVSGNLTVRVKEGSSAKYEDKTGGKGVAAVCRIYADADKKDASKGKILLTGEGNKAVKSFAYTGRPVTFTAGTAKGSEEKVKLSLKLGREILSDEDVEKYFDIFYADNVEKGKATVILSAKPGSVYVGACSTTFTIKNGAFGK